jgi:hypothetical protein
MKTKISIAKWDLEFDKEATELAFVHQSYDCDCSYCQNFLASYHNLPEDYFELLNKLGIDPAKPSEIIEYCKNNDETHFYGWWFHIVGNLEKTSKISETSTKFNDKINILISDDNSLVAKDFPDPIVQIEFFANLPWVIDEEP